MHKKNKKTHPKTSSSWARRSEAVGGLVSRRGDEQHRVREGRRRERRAVLGRKAQGREAAQGASCGSALGLERCRLSRARWKAVHSVWRAGGVRKGLGKEMTRDWERNGEVMVFHGPNQLLMGQAIFCTSSTSFTSSLQAAWARLDLEASHGGSSSSAHLVFKPNQALRAQAKPEPSSRAQAFYPPLAMATISDVEKGLLPSPTLLPAGRRPTPSLRTLADLPPYPPSSWSSSLPQMRLYYQNKGEGLDRKREEPKYGWAREEGQYAATLDGMST